MQPQQQAHTAAHHDTADGGHAHPAADHPADATPDDATPDDATHHGDTPAAHHAARQHWLSEDAMLNNQDHREELCAWLEANGINPIDVPLDGDLTIEGDTNGQRWIRCDVFASNDGGRFMNAEMTGAARERVMAPLKTEPPHWWQPHTGPSREALLEALGAVRQIHREVQSGFGPVCSTCSASAGPTIAYPCDTIKALRVLPSVNIPLDLPDPQEAPCSTSSATCSA